LAASRGSSNGPDWKDVALAMAAFQEQEDCRLTIRIGLTYSPEGVPDLILQATALQDTSGLEVTTLASAHVTCLGTSRLGLEAALFRLLYALDFQSAANAYLRQRDGGA